MPICAIKSRTIKIIFAMLAVVILLCVSIEGSASAQVWFGRSGRLVPIYSVDTEEKQVAISFDAAWGNEDTEELIAILKEHFYTEETKKIQPEKAFYLNAGYIINCMLKEN